MNPPLPEYRVWDKEEEIMLSVAVMDYVVGFVFTLGSYDRKDGTEKTGDIMQNYEIMQSTGMKDKAGKTIWDGDLVKVFNISDPVVVEWLDCAFGFWNPPNSLEATFEVLMEYTGPDGYEVIGNIYENPELTKGEQ